MTIRQRFKVKKRILEMFKKYDRGTGGLLNYGFINTAFIERFFGILTYLELSGYSHFGSSGTFKFKIFRRPDITVVLEYPDENIRTIPFYDDYELSMKILDGIEGRVKADIKDLGEKIPCLTPLKREKTRSEFLAK